MALRTKLRTQRQLSSFYWIKFNLGLNHISVGRNLLSRSLIRLAARGPRKFPAKFATCEIITGVYRLIASSCLSKLMMNTLKPPRCDLLGPGGKRGAGTIICIFIKFSADPARRSWINSAIAGQKERLVARGRRWQCGTVWCKCAHIVSNFRCLVRCAPFNISIASMAAVR